MIKSHNSPIASSDTWQVRLIFDLGDVVQICCTEHAAKTFYDEWVDAVEQEEIAEVKVITLEGFCDTADRAPAKLAARPSTIKTINLVHLYGPFRDLSPKTNL